MNVVPSDLETAAWLDLAADGDSAAVDRLLDAHREQLRRMINARMDRRAQARFDASDVIQDAVIEATRKLPRYLQTREVPFYVWLRQIAWERLVQLHRRHLGAERRRADREVPLLPGLPDQSAIALAEQLAVSGTSPSVRLARRELQTRIQQALRELSAQDREVVVLRHLEQLRLKEVASVLEISEAAAQSRYRRAIERLHSRLEETFPESQP